MTEAPPGDPGGASPCVIRCLESRRRAGHRLSDDAAGAGETAELPAGEPAASPGRTTYRIGMPESVRAMTRRWISLVPSKIV